MGWEDREGLQAKTIAIIIFVTITVIASIISMGIIVSTIVIIRCSLDFGFASPATHCRLAGKKGMYHIEGV